MWISADLALQDPRVKDSRDPQVVELRDELIAVAAAREVPFNAYRSGGYPRWLASMTDDELVSLAEMVGLECRTRAVPIPVADPVRKGGDYTAMGRLWRMLRRGPDTGRIENRGYELMHALSDIVCVPKDPSGGPSAA